MKTIDDLTTTLPTGPGRQGRSRRRWAGIAALAVALVVVLVAWLVVVAGDGDEQVTSGPTTTQAGATTAAPSQPTTTPAIDRSTAIWPVEGSGRSFAEPVAAAEDFAVVFLGFTSPTVGPFQQGDNRSGEVEIRPVADGPATTVFVRQLSGEQTWSVLGAATESIEVTRPAAGEEISSPVRVEGRAFTFEGHVSVEVRQDGRADPAGRGFVTGGGDEMRPFAGDIPFDPGTGGFGALVFLTESAEDGRVWQAAAVRVRLRPAASTTG